MQASREDIKIAKETQIQLWARPTIDFNVDCMKYQNYEFRNLRRFSDDIQEQHRPSLWGTHAATYLLLTYTVFVICITKIYAKTRFTKTDIASTTLKIAGSSLGVSAVIYACLLIPVLPLATKVFRLSFLYEDRECFKEDKYMRLNEDEE